MTDLLDAPPPSDTAPHTATPAGALSQQDPADGARTEPPTSPTPLPLAARRFNPLWRPAAYYLASRIVVFVTAFITAAVYPKLRVIHTFGSIYDGRWYLWIAQHGYAHHLVNEGEGNRWAFFPALPAATRGIAEVTGLSLPDAAALLAFVFGLTATLAIWLAIREVFGARLADRAVLLFVCCPTAYVLSLGYTEGLFLTAAALCLFALSRRWFVLAGLCACAAGLTRNAGVVVIAAVVVTALPAAWRGRTIRPVLGAAIAPLGLAAFMAYGWAMVGTPIAFLTSERFWQGQHFVWFTAPLELLIDLPHQATNGLSFIPTAMAGAALVALVVGIAGIWLLDRMGRQPGLVCVTGPTTRSAVPLSWWVYTVGTLLVAYSAYFTDSIPRYTMVAFPLFVAFAWKLPGRIVGVVAALMACMQAFLLVAVLTIALHPAVVPLIP